VRNGFSRTLQSISIRRNVGHSDGSCVARRLLEGGAETGFHHVEPDKYTPRLMHFSGSGRKVIVNQVNFTARRLTEK